MLKYMLDTNICIYVIKNYPAKLRDTFSRLAEQLSISAITLAELSYGAEKSEHRLDNLHAVEEFAARLEVRPFSAQAAAHYGQIRSVLERSGKTIGPHDLLISAHARAEGLTIVTNNAREFRRVPGLSVENWV